MDGAAAWRSPSETSVMGPSLLWALTLMLNCETVITEPPRQNTTIAERRCPEMKPKEPTDNSPEGRSGR